MSTLAEVRLWGKTIGAVLLEENAQFASFEYERSFIESGIQVAPLMMPLGRAIYRFPALSDVSFHGLPGMLADSLPDRFGNALIDAWLAGQGRSPGFFNAVERLCYTGTRGMGALEFYPIIGERQKRSERIDIDRLVHLASEVLRTRSLIDVHVMGENEKETERALRQILQVGTSAGGARAKAVIAWNPVTNEVRSGQVDASSGFQHWLMKFDGVQGNRDKELADSQGYGTIEYAYYLMARDAGVTISESRLFHENGRNHFMTRRFDRTADGAKLHMQSLGALAHFDYNLAGAYAYEQVFPIMRRLGMKMSSIEEFFRRMVFNIVARNQDDHVKNIAFLMDKSGVWSLAPAYDITYSYQVDGAWTGTHQMTMNGRRDGFTLEDFNSCGIAAGLVRGRAASIVREVSASVGRWDGFAEAAGVPPQRSQAIESTFRKFSFKSSN